MIDMSMEKVRAVIDQACQNGKCYVTIAKSGDDAVDDANLAYSDVLLQTLELMDRCDGVIMTGDWLCSEGCQSEIASALLSRKPVYVSAKQYICFRKLKEAADA